MAPAGVIGFGIDPVTDRPACAAAGQHHFLLPVAPSFPAMQRRLERCGFVPLEMIRHAQSRRRLRNVIDQRGVRSEEHTSELQSLMRISYAVFCLKKKKHNTRTSTN